MLHPLLALMGSAAVLLGAAMSSGDPSAAHSASVMPLKRTDWERFLQPQALPVTRLVDWLGKQPSVEPEVPAIHYYLRDLPPYAGGVDLFADGHGAIESASFYLALGPLYSDAHIAKGRATRTPYTLDEMEAWYGKPFERTTFKRTGGARLIYHFQGDAKRQLVFTALPGSRCLHSISAERDEDGV